MLLGYENFIVFNSTVAFPLKSQQYDWSIALMFPICVRFINLSLFSTTVSYLTRLHIFAILSPQTRFLAQFPPKIYNFCIQPEISPQVLSCDKYLYLAPPEKFLLI